jgi:hypothetical protein
VWEFSESFPREELQENKLAWHTQGIDLSVVEGLPKLQKLVLIGVHTGHDGHWNYMMDLSPLRNCENLRFLKVEGEYGQRPFTKTDLAPLSNCKKLERFSLSRLSLRFIDLSPLSLCPKLESITVTNSGKLTGLKLPSNPAIRTIDISGNQLITIWKIIEGKKWMDMKMRKVYEPSRVEKRSLHECRNLEYVQLLDLEQLIGCVNLDEINLSSNKINVIDLSFVEKIGRTPQINLTNNPLAYLNVYPLVKTVGKKPPQGTLRVDDSVALTWDDELPADPDLEGFTLFAEIYEQESKLKWKTPEPAEEWDLEYKARYQEALSRIIITILEITSSPINMNEIVDKVRLELRTTKRYFIRDTVKKLVYEGVVEEIDANIPTYYGAKEYVTYRLAK